jgi:hypothetical protein
VATASLACLAAAPAALALGEPTANPADPPTISGSARWGATLTAYHGSWDAVLVDPVQSYSYQWERCTPGCAPIAGATQSTYRLVGADVGSRIQVLVQAHNNAGPSEAEASNQLGPVVEDPPNRGSLPSFSGTAEEGRVLTRTSYGGWSSPRPTDYSAEWLRCNTAGGACVEIPAATGDEYELDPSDVGSRIRLRVRADGPYGDAEALSAPSAVVARKPAAPRRKPRRLKPFPRIVVAGALSPGGASFRRVLVRGPRNVKVQVRCRGRGCPFRKRTYRMRHRRLRLRSLERNFRSGAVIELRVVKKGRVGKYTRIRVRQGHVPNRVDRCLNPGSSRPRRCR